MCFKIFAILLIASSVYVSPLNNAKLKFLTDYAAGNVDYGVKPMDPMIIENINVPEEALGINSHFPEMIVTGLKDAVASEYFKDHQEIVHQTLSYSLDAEGTVNLQFPKKNKELTGIIKYEADVKTKIIHSVVDNDDIGPETVTCVASNAKYTISEKFIQILENDPDASAVRPQYDIIHDEHVKKVSCEFAKAMIKVLLNNLRAMKDVDL